MKTAIKNLLVTLALAVFVVMPSLVYADEFFQDSAVTNANQSVVIGIDTGSSHFAGYTNYRGYMYIPGASHNICDLYVYLHHANGADVTASINSYPFGTATSSMTSLFGSWRTLGTATDHFTSTTTSFSLTQFTFSPCVTVVGAGLYSIVFSATPVSTYPLGDYNNSPAVLRAGSSTTYAGTGLLMPVRQNYDGDFFIFTDRAANGIDLLINGTENFSAFEPDGATTTVSNLSGACSGANFFNGSICYMFQYLFVPDSESLTPFHDFVDTLNSKVPFSYITEVYDDFNGVGSGTPASFPDLTMQAGTSTPYSATYNIFSSSTLASVGTRFSGLRTINGYILWAAFGTMCYFTGTSLLKRK